MIETAFNYHFAESILNALAPLTLIGGTIAPVHSAEAITQVAFEAAFITATVCPGELTLAILLVVLPVTVITV